MAEKNGRLAGVLGDFSVSQLLATALAAATSFALSTQIGIAGSVIGAVVGAVASTVAGQVYRNVLAAGGDIQVLAPAELREGVERAADRMRELQRRSCACLHSSR